MGDTLNAMRSERPHHQMTAEEQTVVIIGAAIEHLSPADKKACEDLCEIIRQQLRTAGVPVGPLALAMVGAQVAARRLPRMKSRTQILLEASLLREHLNKLVHECTPVQSPPFPGRYFGVAMPSKETLEAARKVLGRIKP